MEQRHRLCAAGNFRQLMEYEETALAGETDVFVGPFGCAGKAEDGIAAGDEAVGDGVEDFVVDGVAGVLGAGFAKQGQGQPFADERDVAGAVEREGYGLEVAQVLGHFFRVVIGAGAIGSGDQDHQGICGHGGSFRARISRGNMHDYARYCAYSKRIVQFRAMSSDNVE